MAGVPIHIVAARLGDDPKTVLDVYSHLLPQSDEIAADPSRTTRPSSRAARGSGAHGIKETPHV